MRKLPVDEIGRATGAGESYILNLARVYALTGERYQAISELEILAKLYDTVSYGDVRCGHHWDPLQGEPRFKGLVASLASK